MSHQKGFFFFAADWRTNPALRTCSPAARGLWIDLLALMAESETPGILKFGSGENWKFEPDKMTLNCRRDLGSLRRSLGDYRHKIATKSPQNRHKIAIFGELERLISTNRNLIARRLFELYDKGVFACNDAGFIVSSKLIRQAAELQNHRVAQKKYRDKVIHQSSIPIFYKEKLTKERSAPIVPSPDPPSAGAFSFLCSGLEKLKTGKTAKETQAAVAAFLESQGFVCELEYLVADRGDGRRGRIDILATKGAARLAVEIDNRRPRAKSVFKLRQVADARRLIILCADRCPAAIPSGIDRIICLRRRLTKTQIDLQVGAPSPSVGGGDRAEKFKHVWFDAGLPPEKLYEGWVKFGGDWRKIEANGRRRNGGGA